MILTYDQILNRIAERTYDNTRQLRKGVNQRRNGMEDLYGVEFTHNGDATHPATFYISVSPDLVYYERFAFKFVIGAYESSVAGIDISGGGVSIDETSLAISGGSGSKVLSGTSTLDDMAVGSITPNPHNHELEVETISGNASYGIKHISTTSANWRVEIHGVDITDYLIEQHDGDWIDMTDETGYKVFPNRQLDDREDFYDILDVACMLNAEGRIEDRDKLLKPEFKKVQVFSDAPFSLTAFLYLKYSHVNR